MSGEIVTVPVATSTSERAPACGARSPEWTVPMSWSLGRPQVIRLKAIDLPSGDQAGCSGTESAEGPTVDGILVTLSVARSRISSQLWSPCIRTYTILVAVGS